jgi:hypothetical protein
MLKNPNMFISPLRLCFRNIPVDVDEKKLVAIVKKFASHPTGRSIFLALRRIF